MKTIKLMTIVVLLLSFGAVSLQAKTTTIKVKTSAKCEDCKARIEKALSAEPGIQSSKLDVKTKEIAITFDDTKTSADKIKKAIVKTGYDADEMKADLTAYKKLPGCCQKSDSKKS